jgi:SH3 domain protein
MKSMANFRFIAGIIIATLGIISVNHAIAASEKRYVSDVLYVPLHSGKSSKNRIVHRGLKSGTELTLLDYDKKAGFSKVRTANGTEGWMQNQFLSNSPVARQLLTREQQTNASLREQLRSTSSDKKSIGQAHGELKQQVKALSAKNQQLTNELASIKKISSNAVNLDRNNRELLQNNEMLKIEIAELQSDNARLSDKSDKEWFVRGAFAVALGALLAFILPKFKPRPKHSEWV